MVVNCAMAGFSHEGHRWGGTYDHSHTFFDAAVENVWGKTDDAEQMQSPRIRVQTNVHADSNFRTHVNIFDCAGPNQERREWVQALRPGNRIQLYAKGTYPAWLNFVQKAEITIRYHEVVGGKVIGDGSMDELPEEIRKLKTFEQDPQEPPPHQPKIVIYHQSFHAESGILTSLRPLVQEKTGITAVILGKFHLHLSHKDTEMPAQKNGGNGSAAIYLNEYAIDDSSIEGIWVDIEYLQREGVKVIGMLSICGNDNICDDERKWLGSCDDLTFEPFYKALHDLVVSRRLDGFNLDTDVPKTHVNAEGERVSLQKVTRLIDSLHADFGSNFIIVMTASAEALLSPDTNQQDNCLDYRTLELQRGHLISWYNVRIFNACGHGDGQNDGIRESAPNFVHELNSYIRLLRQDFYQAHKVLMAISTNPNAVSEIQKARGAYVDLRLLYSLLELLRWSYGPINFGGVAAWEYSRARALTTGGDARGNGSPWIWVKDTKAILERVFPGRE
jgi:hypothetical protein